MPNNKGTSLQEYTIILGLLLVILIPICLTLRESINISFEEYSNVFKSNPKNTMKVFTPDVNYDFTKNINTSYCENGVCNINLGNFEITGIPENLAELVETSGVSGATDSLMPLLDQLTNQLEEQGLTEESQTLKELANIGYFIGDINEYLENEVDYCLTQKDPEKCFTNFSEESPSINLPDNIKHVIPDFEDYYGTRDNFDIIDRAIDFNNLIGTSSSYNEYYSSILPFIAFNTKYEELMDKPNLPESVKTFIESIYIQIFKLNDESTYQYMSFFEDEESTDGIYDHITGKIISSEELNNASIFDLDNQTTSVGTNFGSTLICEVGENIAENEECK